ncbi:hypothetical protein J6590_071735 [Homalodisca vitripennis]|nr:hypothetical protein J6590_071735 [Homalodisca vitripennis]
MATSFPPFDSYVFFLWGFIKDKVYIPPLPASLADLRRRIAAAVAEVTPDLLERQPGSELKRALALSIARPLADSMPDHCPVGDFSLWMLQASGKLVSWPYQAL